jgi:hypothetical protein
MGIKRTAVLAAAVMAVVLMASQMAEAANSRSVTVRIKASEAQDDPVAEMVKLYGASHALVIGIDEYSQGWPLLSNAVNDAKLVASELRGRGFTVTLKTNLKSEDLKKAFEEFFIIDGEDEEARLFVWYAGHGFTEGGEGYLVPTDAPAPDAGARFRMKALSLRRFGEYVRQANAKHAFSVFDSCFSGTIFRVQRSRPPAAVTWNTALPVRQFLSSGDANEEVSDDGRFRKLFLRALRGEETADANRDGYLTASEMGLFLTDRLTNLTDSAQRPRYGKLQDEDWDQGDFVFVLPRSASLPASGTTMQRPPSGMTAEMMFWRSIQNSRTAADFEDYLAQFPNGTFARLAKRKAKELKESQIAALPPAAGTILVDDMDATLFTVKRANLRAQPTSKSKRVGQVNVDTALAVTGEVTGRNWYRIAYQGRTAYVFAPLIAEQVAPWFSGKWCYQKASGAVITSRIKRTGAKSYEGSNSFVRSRGSGKVILTGDRLTTNTQVANDTVERHYAVLDNGRLNLLSLQVNGRKVETPKMIYFKCE